MGDEPTAPRWPGVGSASMSDTASASDPGRFVWYELLTTDSEEAKAFSQVSAVPEMLAAKAHAKATAAR